MGSLLDAADQYRKEEAEEPSIAPRAEEEDGVLTLSGDWPVRIDDDLDAFISFFGYDPKQWEVADLGKMSKWQQSKRTDSGDRDVVWLYSYRGVKFQKRTEEHVLEEKDLADAIERAKSWRPSLSFTVENAGPPATFVHLQGDNQAGKSAGGGLEGLQQREEAALQKSLSELARLMRLGVNIERICIAEAGDAVEGIFGHYGNQTRTVATMREQYRYAVESQVSRIKAFAEFGLPLTLAYTPSNHGEHRPGLGLSPLTSESDNLDLQIAETVRFVLEQTGLGQQIEWHIPHDDFMTPFELSGVGVGLTHGHKIRGSGIASIEKWTMAQRDRLMFHEDFKMRLLMMGHRHHFLAEELSGTSVIMTPSMDGGSEWFTSSSGQIAVPGLLTFTVSQAHAIGWGNLQMH